MKQPIARIGDYGCVDCGTFPDKTVSRKARLAWVAKHKELYFANINSICGVVRRVVTPVELVKIVKNDKTCSLGKAWMDAITGTLFHIGDGQCFSSGQRTLDVSSLTRIVDGVGVLMDGRPKECLYFYEPSEKK